MTGREIVEIRVALGLSTHDLATALNVGYPTVKRWESHHGIGDTTGPVGLARAVLTGIQSAISEVRKDRCADQQLAEIGRELKLGLGGMLFSRIMGLVHERRKKHVRGVDYPCEGCGELKGSFLNEGWHRCKACGYPSK